MPTRPARDATISDELPAGHSASLLRTPYGDGRFVPSLSPEVCGLSRASYMRQPPFSSNGSTPVHVVPRTDSRSVPRSLDSRSLELPG
jgi:hypothetical protein